MNNVKSLFPDSTYESMPHALEELQHFKTEDGFTLKYGTGINNIKVVENFLSDEECDKLIAFTDQYKVWSERDHCYPLHMAEDFDSRPLMSKWYHSEMNTMGPRMVSAAENAWNEKLNRHNDCMLVVNQIGSYHKPHTDILDIHYENNNPYADKGPSVEDQTKLFKNMWSGHLSILVYLNDDYGRGELYFPQHDYWIKPQKGSLVTFPGSLHYVHGVTTVEDKIRYTLSQWAKFDYLDSEYKSISV